jgi:uncharacterized RDD family membrane protein YckC
MNTTNPYAPPQAAVQDVAEQASGELAGRLLRLGTAILDGIIAMVMIGIPFAISMVFDKAGVPVNGDFNFTRRLGIGILLPLAGLIAYIWLNVMFVSGNGQSIGKKITGIKVVRSDGSRASLGRIFWLRNVLTSVLTGMFGSIPVIGFVFGLVDPLLIFGQARQCLHDKIADTIVIKA